MHRHKRQDCCALYESKGPTCIRYEFNFAIERAGTNSLEGGGVIPKQSSGSSPWNFSGAECKLVRSTPYCGLLERGEAPEQPVETGGAAPHEAGFLAELEMKLISTTVPFS